jgi:hypothetical protein
VLTPFLPASSSSSLLSSSTTSLARAPLPPSGATACPCNSFATLRCGSSDVRHRGLACCRGA